MAMNEFIENTSQNFKKHIAPITSVDIHPGDIHKNASVSIF